MKKITTKTWLFIAIIFAFFLPIIQQIVPIIKLIELNGSFEKKQYQAISFDSWFNGEYQQNTEKYLNEQFGFRSIFVKIYNQMYYSLFNTPKANSVLIGKNNYLYEEAYINAYFGNDFIGNDSIKRKVQRLKKIEEALKKSNTDLIIVLAPGKASYYPEYIPENLITKKKTTNYEIYQKELSQQQLSFVDFNKWFCDMKDTSSYPLFPKTGIHWSKYGELLAADSLIKFIQKKRNKPLPSLQMKEMNPSTRAQFSDNDIERGMNLLFKIPNIEMAYPNFDIINRPDTKPKAIVIENDKNEKNLLLKIPTIKMVYPVNTNPKAIVVSDSYYWEMFNWGISDKVFNNGKFWYYNEQIYPDSYETSLKVNDVDLKKELENVDLVILMTTDANLYKFAFGFIEEVYAELYNEKQASNSKEKRIKHHINAIKGTPKWLESIRINAEKDSMSLDEAILKMAEYIVWQEEMKKKK